MRISVVSKKSVEIVESKHDEKGARHSNSWLPRISMAVAACPLQAWMDDPKRSSALDDSRTDFPQILVLLVHCLSFSTQGLFDP
jgi:hypothetical protein